MLGGMKYVRNGKRHDFNADLAEGANGHMQVA